MDPHQAQTTRTVTSKVTSSSHRDRTRGSLDGPDCGSSRRCHPPKGEAAPLIWKQILINLVSNDGLVFLSICGPRIKYATNYLQVSFSSFLHFDFSEKVILQWNRGTTVLVWSQRSYHGTVTAFCIVRFKWHFWNTTTHMYYLLFPTAGTSVSYGR